MNISDTIAAVSTPRGKGGIAVLRVSGSQAISVAETVFVPRSGTPLSGVKPNMTVYGEIRFPEPDGSYSVIDDGMATCFYAPRSFTGEDTVEISCHGGLLVTSQVLAALLSAGARQAEAGEFTRRAFVNGKLNLSQAEALGNLLEAQTHSQLLLSRGGMEGILSTQVQTLYRELREIVASVYAKIDFPDEDLSQLSDEDIRLRLTDLSQRTQKLCQTYQTGKAVCQGIRTVICGPTNAGKSSLYNQLVGREAAIVTDVAGTTRDLLEETVTVGPVLLRLCDTAGLRDSNDKIEAMGIAKARAELEKAELVLAVFDASVPMTDEDTRLLEKLATLTCPVFCLLNKSDRKTCWGAESLPVTLRKDADSVLSLSAETGDGLETLKDLIQRRFCDGSLSLRDDAIVANARQYAALSSASGHLRQALEAIAVHFSPDVSCVDLELAMSALAEIDGREVTEDIVSEIFSHFCVGK